MLLAGAAAFGAGCLNAIAGGGTLLTYPALVWLGFDPRVANATSTVALWPGALGGAWGYRREMTESRPLLRRLLLPSLLGGAAGSALLLVTPSATFERVVPFLILFATALFMAQAPLIRWMEARGGRGRSRRAGALLLELGAAVYGGYFGAGLGILLLAVLGLRGVRDIHAANGVKALCGLCINGVAALAFAASGMVAWPEALIMAVAAVAGGVAGAALARRLGRRFARGAVVTTGLFMGAWMLVR
jgi:uncharacterized membrane protein YfcA